MEDLMLIDKMPGGVVKIPPSKSLAHRAVLCAALSRGRSVIHNIDLSQDISATIDCVSRLGAKCELVGRTLMVEGISNTSKGNISLNCGESGSTLRFLLPLSTLFSDRLSFTGQGRLLNRPQKEYFDVLSKKGMMCIQEEGEIAVSGRLQKGIFHMAGHISSQFVSGLLLALPLLEGDSEIVLKTPLQSKGYVDLTIEVMHSFGVFVENENYERFLIKGNQSYKPQEYALEGDYSNAAFFWWRARWGAISSASD